MSDTCQKCGLPQELCVCEDIAREDQQIKVSLSERRWGKMMTVVRGFDDDVDLGDLETKLKKKLACGGTHKDGQIELQGDHTRRIKDVLEGLGFDRNSIEISK